METKIGEIQGIWYVMGICAIFIIVFGLVAMVSTYFYHSWKSIKIINSEQFKKGLFKMEGMPIGGVLTKTINDYRFEAIQRNHFFGNTLDELKQMCDDNRIKILKTSSDDIREGTEHLLGFVALFPDGKGTYLGDDSVDMWVRYALCLDSYFNIK